MSDSSGILPAVRRLVGVYHFLLRGLVLALAGVAAAAFVFMMALTCADVVLRMFGRPITGALDLVKLASAVALSCALPYTTAVKGHVAIEYFFHKLPRRGRIVVDTLVRLLGMGLFGVLAWESFRYGLRLSRAGRVSDTLQVPISGVALTIALASAVVVLVILHNLLHPGKEMIKP